MTGSEIVNKIFPSAAQGMAEKQERENQRYAEAVQTQKKAHEVRFKEWNVERATRLNCFNAAIGEDQRTTASVAQLIENYTRQSAATSEAYLLAHIVALQHGRKVELAEADQLRAKQETMLEKDLPALVKQQKAAQVELWKAKADYETWLATNPEPSQNYQVS